MSALAGLMAAQLARASVEGALFAGAVWLVCRLAPRLPAATRALLWWAACLKLIVGLAWVAPLPLPLLPAERSAGLAGRWTALLAGESRPAGAGLAKAKGTSSPASRALAGASRLRPAAVQPAGAARGELRTPPQRRHGAWPSRAVEAAVKRTSRDRKKVAGSLPLAALLAGTWLLGALAGLAAVAVQIGRARRVLRGSAPMASGPVAARFASLCWEIGMRRVPELRCSAAVSTPQAVGLWRPAVLLPQADLSRLSDGELEMALCHELVHLRRGDLWLGWVPALAERLFFFHPLAALAAREHALAREAACDAEVLRLLGSAPRDYGRLLLRLGTTRRSAPAFALGAAPAASTLKRRLEMLQLLSDRPRRRAWTWVAAAAVLVALPSFRLVALTPRTAAPAPALVAAAAPSIAAPAPAAPVPAARSAHAFPVRPADVAAAVMTAAPRAAAVRAEPADPEPADPEPAAAERGSGEPTRWTWNSDDGNGEFEAYVLRLGNSHFMHGSDRDVKRLKEEKGDLLWFRRNGQEYIVRDAATLQAARKLFQPQIELGERQAELGSRQAELGSRQAKLGSQQAELGARQAELGERQRKLAERDGGEDSGLEEQMRELGRRQGELGEKQGELGEKQAELGRQQGELGRQQAEAARKAEAGLARLVDDAVARGLAQPIDR